MNLEKLRGDSVWPEMQPASPDPATFQSATGAAMLLPDVQRLQVSNHRLRIAARHAVLRHWRARVLAAPVKTRHQEADCLTVRPSFETRNRRRHRDPARNRMGRLEIELGPRQFTPRDLLTSLITRRVAVPAHRHARYHLLAAGNQFRLTRCRLALRCSGRCNHEQRSPQSNKSCHAFPFSVEQQPS